ncbi:hypothetical protein RB614_40555 [Phytohabitans sp. ZYX-F-186]|uniref:Antitoxin VbhA domain-containing protein n=1 Tax=Phytohabitans maris TaxID=3071409 RepID=A0ABU0ZWC4_9ACTN|nr:hypothetical protein [Phytohabitans sp. ZYX-F-186]MDQ7910802.1 hypothetical protein [Phytohabitans sp. ZYX-F-186]
MGLSKGSERQLAASRAERDRLQYVGDCKQDGNYRQALNAMTSDEVWAEVARSTDGGSRG